VGAKTCPSDAQGIRKELVRSSALTNPPGLGHFCSGGFIEWGVQNLAHTQTQKPQTERHRPRAANGFFTFGKVEQTQGFTESGRFLIVAMIYLVFTDKSSNLFRSRC